MRLTNLHEADPRDDPDREPILPHGPIHWLPTERSVSWGSGGGENFRSERYHDNYDLCKPAIVDDHPNVLLLFCSKSDIFSYHVFALRMEEGIGNRRIPHIPIIGEETPEFMGVYCGYLRDWRDVMRWVSEREKFLELMGEYY